MAVLVLPVQTEDLPQGLGDFKAITMVSILVVLGGYSAILFGCAGRWDLPWFWAVLLVQAVIIIMGLLVIDPDLMKERFHPGKGGLDRHLRFTATPFLLASLILAGLDARYGWSSDIPILLRILGLLAQFLGGAIGIWALAINRFFSPVVRIQEERGHCLITDGPYRFIRHPGYLGFLVGFASWGLPLGSWWSILPAVPVALLFLRRVLIEDRFLHENLPGYEEYAGRVAYRLIPGVW